MKICPYCGEKIQDSAKKCRYCGEWLNKDTKDKDGDKKNKKISLSTKHILLIILAIIILLLILLSFFLYFKGKNNVIYGDNIETVTDKNGHQFKYGTITIGDITMMDRNLGAEGAGTGFGTIGYYYQRGNNYGFNGWMDPYVKTSNYQVNAASYGPGGYSNSNFILGYESWDKSYNNDLWGDNTDTVEARQGPCPTGWHIPTMGERQKVMDYRTELGYDRNSKDALIFIDDFKLPLAGFYGYASNGLVENGEYGYYWTSSPYIGYDDLANVLRFYVKNSYYDNSFIGAEIQYENHIYRANGAQIRCFKN